MLKRSVFAVALFAFAASFSPTPLFAQANVEEVEIQETFHAVSSGYLITSIEFGRQAYLVFRDITIQSNGTLEFGPPRFAKLNLKWNFSIIGAKDGAGSSIGPVGVAIRDRRGDVRILYRGPAWADEVGSPISADGPVLLPSFEKDGTEVPEDPRNPELATIILRETNWGPVEDLDRHTRVISFSSAAQSADPSVYLYHRKSRGRQVTVSRGDQVPQPLSGFGGTPRPNRFPSTFDGAPFRHEVARASFGGSETPLGMSFQQVSTRETAEPRTHLITLRKGRKDRSLRVHYPSRPVSAPGNLNKTKDTELPSLGIEDLPKELREACKRALGIAA